MTDVFTKLGANRKKIAFTKADGTTQLYAEIEKWNWTGTPATSEAWIWVSRDGWDISKDNDTEFYIYYDNTKADNTTYIGDAGLAGRNGPRELVWNDEYEAVYHFHEGEGVALIDSTSHDRDGTEQGNIVRGQACIRDDGDDFNSAGYWLLPNAGFGTLFDEANGHDWTVEMWWYFKTSATQRIMEFFETYFGPYASLEAGQVWFRTFDGAVHQVTDVAPDILAWTHYCHIGIGGGYMRLMKNGGQIDNKASWGTQALDLTNVIGSTWGGDYKANAKTDFFAVHSAGRSNAYCKSSFHSGQDTLVSYSDCEAATTVTTDNATNIKCESATMNGTIVGGGVNERGFEWGLVSGGPYPNSWTETAGAPYGAGSYSYNAPLSQFTTYYYRAKIRKGAIWSYGAEKIIVTPCCDEVCDNPRIDLRWDDNSNTETAYYVERDDGGWHVIATLPANSTTYSDTTVECGVAYLYRVRAWNPTGYSGYVTLSSPIICPCLTEEEKQHITNAIKEWAYDYSFSNVPTEKIKAGIISRIEETKRIKSGIISSLFEEVRRIRGKIGLERFEETLSVKFPLLIKFTETCQIMGNLIKKFQETKPIIACVFFWFVEGKEVYGETKSIEEDTLEKLEEMESEE